MERLGGGAEECLFEGDQLQMKEDGCWKVSHTRLQRPMEEESCRKVNRTPSRVSAWGTRPREDVACES